MRGTAAKRLGTIRTVIGQVAVRRTRLMTGSNGNQSKPWLDPQGTRKAARLGVSLALQRLQGRRPVRFMWTGVRYSLAPG